MEDRMELDNIIVILVLYKSPLRDSDAFNSLTYCINLYDKDKIVDLIIYDNSPLPLYNGLDSFRNWRIRYIHDSTNPGLSKAANEGYYIARSLNKSWILFVNPDTKFDPNYFDSLWYALKTNPQIQLLVPILISGGSIVSPSKFVFKRGRPFNEIEPGIHNFQRKSVLFSGMFISLEAFNKTGGFNNKIKLDYMDFYFIDQFKKHYSNFYLLDSKCEHNLSSTVTDKTKVLIRFQYFCEGGYHYAKSLEDIFQVGFFCFLRSIKLAFRYTDFRFLSIFFKTYILKKNIIA